jgi:hypothetical protein
MSNAQNSELQRAGREGGAAASLKSGQWRSTKRNRHKALKQRRRKVDAEVDLDQGPESHGLRERLGAEQWPRAWGEEKSKK